MKQWTAKVQESIGDYHRQAQRLAAMLGNDLPMATAFLGRESTLLQAYASLGAPSGGGPVSYGPASAGTLPIAPSGESAAVTTAEDVWRLVEERRAEVEPSEAAKRARLKEAELERLWAAGEPDLSASQPATNTTPTPVQPNPGSPIEGELGPESVERRSGSREHGG